MNFWLESVAVAHSQTLYLSEWAGVDLPYLAFLSLCLHAFLSCLVAMELLM